MFEILSLEKQFLVQSFKETLQYCDEWRKFTSVSQSVSESFSHSVNSGGGANFEHVAGMSSLQGFNQNYWNLLKFSYTTVYAVVRTDGKDS